jgi:hypothetical protein
MVVRLDYWRGGRWWFYASRDFWQTPFKNTERAIEWVKHMVKDSKDTRLDNTARPLAKEDSPALPSAREKNSDGIPPKAGKRTSNGGRDSVPNAWASTPASATAKPVIPDADEKANAFEMMTLWRRLNVLAETNRDAALLVAAGRLIFMLDRGD